MEGQVKITIEELFQGGIWEDYCRVCGCNEWAVNEGLVRKDEVVYLTLDEAKELGLI